MSIFSFVVMFMSYVLLFEKKLKIEKKNGCSCETCKPRCANENEKESNEFKSCRMDLGDNCGIELRLTRNHMYVNFGKVSVKKIRLGLRVKLTLNFESKARRNFSIVDKRQSVPSRHFLIYLRHGL